MSMLPWSSNPNNPYQVTEDDKDFLTLAANLNVNYDQLKAANPSVQSLSQGQFINVPNLTPSSSAPNQFLQPTATPRPPALPTTPTGSFLSGSGTPNTFQGVPQNTSVYFNSEKGLTPPQVNTGTFAPGMSAETLLSMTQRTINQFNATGYIDPNLPPQVFQQLILAGADPVAIQQAKQNAQAQAAPVQQGAVVNPSTGQAYGAGDTQAGTPGHYYVDQSTAKLLGQTITLKDGKKRILAADKNGRLYYIKPQYRRRPARVFEQTPQEEVRADAPSTVLNVVLGG